MIQKNHILVWIYLTIPLLLFWFISGFISEWIYYIPLSPNWFQINYKFIIIQISIIITMSTMVVTLMIRFDNKNEDINITEISKIRIPFYIIIGFLLTIGIWLGLALLLNYFGIPLLEIFF